MQKIILHCIFVVGPLTSWLFSRVWVKAIQGYLTVALGFCWVLENCIYSNIFYLQAEILNDHLKDKDFFTLVQRPLKFFVILDSQMPFECAVCYLHVLYVFIELLIPCFAKISKFMTFFTCLQDLAFTQREISFLIFCLNRCVNKSIAASQT